MSQRQRRRKAEQRKHAEQRIASKRRIAAGATIAMGATLAATGSAQGATFTVSNLNDSDAGSLRQAVNDATANGPGSDDIVFASGLSGTINVGTFSGNGLYPGSAMNIQGPGADKITLRGTNNVGYIIYTGFDFPEATGNPGDPITISGLTLTGGHATASTYSSNGGGIFNQDANLTVSGSVITGNQADHFGGGIFSSGATGSNLTVLDSTISGNSANPTVGDGYGGGIFAASDATIRGSAIFDNSAYDGGGIYSSGTDPSNLTVQNSTIATNHAVSDDGGGIWFCCGANGEKLTLQGSTVTGNTTMNTAGGVEAYIESSSDPAPEIDNTIISGNTSTNDPQFGDVYFEYPANVAFSLIGNPGPAGLFNQTGPNLLGADPQLGPLQNNGGPTPNEAPAAGSPVIDKGKAFGLTTDQRGVLRPIDFPSIPNAAGGDGADIGAFELQPDNALKLGKLKRNKKKGTAKQLVILPLPDAGSVTIKGKGLKTKTVQVHDNGRLKLKVIPKGKKRKALNASGKVKIKAKVIYNATGNAAKTVKRKVKLLKK
jgi:hypothetical protein